MKKTLIVLMTVLLAAMLITSCHNKYKVGDIGPAGGYIFYDCDADNTKNNPKGEDGLESSETGWRYLEAAPKDLDGIFQFGYYLSEGTTVKNVGTSTALGSGEKNTSALVSVMMEVNACAAIGCENYSIESKGKTYDDWFLPSRDELNLMYENLKKAGLGSFKDVYYLSSSETSDYYCWRQYFEDGLQETIGRSNLGTVRPIRAFL